MAKLEQLTKRIQELVPDIMKLEFGCYIDGSSYSMAKIIKCHENHPFMFCATVLVGDYKISEQIDFDKREVKIIGRDITLEDVLRALFLCKTSCTGVGVSGAWMCGSEYLAPLTKQSIEGTHWRHSIPLHLQSKKTIELLFNLLCE